MADAGDHAHAVVFLETNLGTRFAVSFPSRGTTVADLKRQASAQHSVCFPRAAPIAVTSLQVQRDGFLYVLSDSMDVQSAFGGADGTWHLRVDADAECGSGDPEPSASLPISQNSMQNLSPPAARAPQGGGNDYPPKNQPHTPQEYLEMVPGFGVAAGDSDMAPSHQDKYQECLELEHASGQQEEGSNDMRQQSSDHVVVAAENDAPPPSCQENQPHQGLSHSAAQRKDENTMSEQISNHDAAACEDNGPLQVQKKVTIMYTRGRKCVRQEDANNESIAIELDGCHISLASSTFLVDSDSTEQENLELLDDQGDQSRSGKDATWTQGVCNGENRHNGSDVPPCVESTKGQKSSEKEVRTLISKVHTPGLCSGQSNCNETDTTHCADSEKEEACYPRTRRQRWVAVRKVPKSIAKEMYAFSSTDNHQEHSLECNNDGAQKMSEKEGVQKLSKQNNSKVEVRSSRRFSNKWLPVGQKVVMRKIGHNLEVPGGNHQEHSLKCNNDGALKMSEKEGVQKLNKQRNSGVEVRSSPRFANKWLPVGQKAVMKKIEHNLEVPGACTGPPKRFAQEGGGTVAAKRTKKKMKTRKLNGLCPSGCH